MSMDDHRRIEIDETATGNDDQPFRTEIRVDCVAVCRCSEMVGRWV